MKESEPGRNLRAARRHLRLSQTAAATFIGTTRQSLAAFERGVRQPDLKQLLKLCNLYRLTPDELIGGTRSAVQPAVTPTFHARLNALKDVTELDRAELAAFDSYLQRRSRSAPRLPHAQQPFETIRGVVSRVMKDAGLHDTAPVPIFALLAKHGIEVRFTALGELAGALLVADDDEHPDGVLVNSDQPYDRQRFSAAHEFGHLVLGHKAHEGGFVSYLGRRFEPTEVHADQFASELLVPAHVLAKKVATLSPSEPLAHRVYRLASAFLVSFQAMVNRLVNLGALKPEDREALDKVKPGTLAKALGPTKGGGQEFRTEWLQTVARESLPTAWQGKADPDTVRLLQESAYAYYVGHVPEEAATDAAGLVYEKTALWVAREYPVVTS
jgi:Zn-dependent peptidase ImmA (M78 family)/transcriptional regulator with XRE-family HTH domain